MVVVALSGWWTVGWITGVAVVLVAAVLILLITSIARKITAEARDITAGLDGVSGKTRALRDVTRTQRAVAQITNGLRRARGETTPYPSRPGGVGPGYRTPEPSRGPTRRWGGRQG